MKNVCINENFQLSGDYCRRSTATRAPIEKKFMTGRWRALYNCIPKTPLQSKFWQFYKMLSKTYILLSCENKRYMSLLIIKIHNIFAEILKKAYQIHRRECLHFSRVSLNVQRMRVSGFRRNAVWTIVLVRIWKHVNKGLLLLFTGYWQNSSSSVIIIDNSLLFFKLEGFYEKRQRKEREKSGPHFTFAHANFDLDLITSYNYGCLWLVALIWSVLGFILLLFNYFTFINDIMHTKLKIIKFCTHVGILNTVTVN